MPIAALDPAVLNALAAVLGDTDNGLTGTQIGAVLAQLNLPDPRPVTKRQRLLQSWTAEQARTGSAACVLTVLERAMAPVSYTGRPAAFAARRDALNAALAFAGLHLTEAGKVVPVTASRTLSEAAQRTSRLRSGLLARGAHREVFRFCTAELLADDCSAAVFEATKGLAERIRELTGLVDDGAALVDVAFSVKQPHLAFNALSTPTQRSEQMGLATNMKGVFGAFRNPAAHEVKLLWPVSEADALDLLGTLSLLHRRLDTAAVVPRPSA